ALSAVDVCAVALGGRRPEWTGRTPGSYGFVVTSPQDPWQQGGSPQQPPGGYPQQPGNQPQQYPGGPPPGGYPQYPGAAPRGMPDPYAAPPPPGQQGGPPRPTTVETAFWIAVVVPILVTVLTVISFLVGQGFSEELMARSLGETTPEALEFG